ncbi:MAG: hypothetical protein QMB43_06810 [Alistipes putredinis]
MPNEKITGNPAEKPADKVSEIGAEKPAGRRDGRRGRPQGGQQNRSQQGAQRDKQHDSPQNKPQAETQSGPGRQSEVRECPGGEHRGARQSASRGGRSGERQNLRTADSRSGNYGRSGSSRPADGTAVGKPAFNWTWRDYALQLSVVIIGIVVTFAGSGLIERWRVAREVRATMLLVHAELETNRADFMQVWDYQQWEMRACKFLTDNRRDLKRIPSDTLASFDPVYGRIHFFHPRRDAFGARQGLPAGRHAGIRRAGRFGGEYLDVLPVKTHCPERHVQGLQRETAGAFLDRGHVRAVGMYFLGAVFCRIHADSALLFSGGIYRRIVGGRRSVDTGDRSEIQTG